MTKIVIVNSTFTKQEGVMNPSMAFAHFHLIRAFCHRLLLPPAFDRGDIEGLSIRNLA